MEPVSAPIIGSGNSLSTGGFLNPDSIVSEFGVKERMNIADFGSGAGYFTILMAERTGKEGRVYALDIMESALDSVREKARAVGLENIEAIRTNLEVLGSSGLSDQSQDIVLLANILFQSEKKVEIIREAKRVLKDNGSLVIIDWKKGAGAMPDGRQGFGPPDSLRTDEVAMRSLATDEGLIFERSFDAGQFHFGGIFHKMSI